VSSTILTRSIATIDFSQLKVLTPQEREEKDERRRNQAIFQKMVTRRERSRKSVTVSLNGDAQCRNDKGIQAHFSRQVA